MSDDSMLTCWRQRLVHTWCLATVHLRYLHDRALEGHDFDSAAWTEVREWQVVDILGGTTPQYPKIK